MNKNHIKHINKTQILEYVCICFGDAFKFIAKFHDKYSTFNK